MSDSTIKISKNLRSVAMAIDQHLTAIAGEPIGFTLFVWSEGHAQYVSTTTDRSEVKKAVMTIFDGWDKGMPDIPVHEKQ